MIPFIAIWGTSLKRKLVTLRSTAFSFSRRRQQTSRLCNSRLMVQLKEESFISAHRRNGWNRNYWTHSQVKKNGIAVYWKSSIKQNHDVQCFTEKLICGWVRFIGWKTKAVPCQECNLFLQRTPSHNWLPFYKCWVELVGRQLGVQLQ